MNIEDRRTFAGLQHIVHRLREDCPWDRQQTHASLKPHLLEEAYEALAALDEGDSAKLREELGDLLWQVLIHTEIAREAGEFDYGDLFATLSDKLIRRHPDVFAELKVDSADEVVANWEVIKQEERGEARGLLDGVSQAMPALAYSQSILGRAARVGFDLPTGEDALPKLTQELAAAKTPKARQEAFGDILFT